MRPWAKTCFLAAAVALAGSAAPAPGESAWVVRPMTASTSDHPWIYNADVMVSPAGDLAVGYSLTQQAVAGAGPVTLARFNGCGFDYGRFDMIEPEGAAARGLAATFDMDEFGNVCFASRMDLAPNGIAIGQDAGVWSPMQAAIVEELYCHGLHPIVALDQHGIPAVAGSQGDGSGMFYSRFDIASGRWESERVPGPDGSALWPKTAMCLDGDNRPAIAYVDDFGTVILARRGALGWQTNPVGTCTAWGGVSVAAGPDGSVAVAYQDPTYRLRLAVSSGASLTVEDVGAGGQIIPHGLAYDPDGNAAIVYGTLAEGGRLHLARRVEGTWTYQDLPGKAFCGSLTFDAAGNPYVAGIGQGTLGGRPYRFVQLIGPTVAELLPGDANADGLVAGADYTIWADHYDPEGLNPVPPWSEGGFAYGNFNEDNCVAGADYTLWADNYLQGGLGGADIPEPAGLAALALAARGLAGRRRKPRGGPITRARAPAR